MASEMCRHASLKNGSYIFAAHLVLSNDNRSQNIMDVLAIRSSTKPSTYLTFSKTCFKRSLNDRQNQGLKDKW